MSSLVRVSGSPKSTGARVTRVVFLIVFVAILVLFVVIGSQVLQAFSQ